mmetsp:Transcript_10407/g.19558  ORF Transcript_10407/g.19558 Transcript_10407/m.19558 type:complete len:553 (+) Transcript_10407:303-1961(+)|eukprot:CAMPEP_0197475684 /NCGR_PEP_ID=MMETSP1309-20131121/7113_1 /TAXON_ID=464262 /ORGANISM="Genus nov. species nov., Strain RCC998" /LENGTH=552 /DNA_ID=CAMNT_0043015793 /DNA_START=255 /DNA_END=1913 /DNA_ORIENTATION=+
MVWCSTCKAVVEAEVDEAHGFSCCTSCGKVLDDNIYSSDPTFLKTATGASQVEGNFVPESGIAPTLTRGPRGSVTLSFQSQDSHEKTLNRGRSEINELADRLSIRPREDIAAAAHRLYKLAVQRNFTRGRRTQQVAAACLYTICRQEQKPYMLIDFSDCIQANVYLLGAVFLQLIQLLRLESHPIISRPIDPSLYIHRFADRMDFGKSMHTVANSALRLVASMKRDWMQTGRRPAGICGAALFIASHMHGFRRKKKDIVDVVHVCEATIKKRLGEFEDTPSAQLTSSEFEKWGIQYEKEQDLQTNQLPVLSITNGAKQDLDEIVKLCGGFSGGQDPPSFKRAQALKESGVPQLEYRKEAVEIVNALDTTDDNLSDIDDDEINEYMHTKKEMEAKDKLWEHLNHEYLMSQPQVEQSDANAKSAGKDGGQQESRAKKRRNKSGEDKYSADTASEASYNMLTTKRKSTKINYNALQELFDEVPKDNAGKDGTPGETPEQSQKAGANTESNEGVPEDYGDDARFLNSGMGLGFGITLGESLNPSPRKKKKNVRFAS